MKKTILLLLSCSLLLTLCACGSSTETVAAEGTYAGEMDQSRAEDEGSVGGTEDKSEFCVFTDVELTGALPFSDGIAWVQYQQGGETVTSAIDADGHIMFSVSGDIYYCSAFRDGIAYYVESCDCDDSVSKTSEHIIDTSGTILYSSGDGLSGTDKEEHILAQGDGEFLTVRHTSGMEADYWYFATVDSNGGMVSKKSPQVSDNNWYYEKIRSINGDYLSFQDDSGDRDYYNRYMGDGVWYLKGRSVSYDSYLNMRDGVIKTYTGTITSSMNVLIVDQPAGEMHDGKILTNSGFVLDTDLRVIDLTKSTSSSCQATGGIFFDNDIDDQGRGYYDFTGQLILSVDIYPELCVTGYAFHNDLAVQKIIGVDNNKYVTVIDKTGAEQFEPIKCLNFNDRVANGYLLFRQEDEDWYLCDMSGNVVHNVSADIETIGGALTSQWEDTDDGAIFLYEKDGMTYFLFYDFAAAAAMGDSIYTVGVSGSGLAAEDGSSSATGEVANTSDKTYVTMSGFSIEGKWKSVGNYGFGQAQPGTIVAFDGTNCNFFSPRDTYTFYQDGDDYKLECTSFLSTDTQTFTVKIVDKDNIDVLHGGQTTELTRVP